MDVLHKLEKQILDWTKHIPHLPTGVRKWIGENVWWIVLVGTILSGIFLLVAINGLFTIIAFLNSPTMMGYYLPGVYSSWTIVTSVVSLIFSAAAIILSAMAIKPLRTRLKQGWVLLFLVFLLNAVSVVVSAILSLSIIGFIFGILFGAIGIAISGYLLFEIHGQFAHEAKIVREKKAE